MPSTTGRNYNPADDFCTSCGEHADRHAPDCRYNPNPRRQPMTIPITDAEPGDLIPGLLPGDPVRIVDYVLAGPTPNTVVVHYHPIGRKGLSYSGTFLRTERVDRIGVTCHASVCMDEEGKIECCCGLDDSIMELPLLDPVPPEVTQRAKDTFRRPRRSMSDERGADPGMFGGSGGFRSVT